MNVYFLGEYIKKQREKLGLTQEQVCEGICEQVSRPFGERDGHLANRAA